MIGVDEIQADRGVANADLTRAWIAHGDFFPAHLLGTTVLMNANDMRHVCNLLQTRGNAPGQVYSALIPASLTTFDHLVVSALMNLP